MLSPLYIDSSSYMNLAKNMVPQGNSCFWLVEIESIWNCSNHVVYTWQRRNRKNFWDDTHALFVSTKNSFVLVVSEEEIYKDSANQNQELPMVAMFLQDDYANVSSKSGKKTTIVVFRA
jgi:uncharacterized protein YaeQ